MLEAAWFGVINLRDGWKDRRYGRALAERREAVVSVERKRVEDNPPPPVKIEPVDLAIPLAKKAEVRIEKERQAPMFFDAPGEALPPLHLLDEAQHNNEDLPGAETLEFTSRLIERKLADFGVQVLVSSAHPGPVVTRYEIEPATGIKGATIVGLAKDLARALSLVSIRVVETVPGKSCMALELPNPRRQTVRLSEILGAKVYHDMHSHLTMALGKDISGQPMVADLAKMPHLLVAGTTGSGKSVGINAMILSLLYKSEPKDVRLILVDPKMLELSGLRRHPAPAGARRHRHDQGGQRTALVRRRNGASLQADEHARRAQPRRLQCESARGRKGRHTAARSAGLAG